LIIMIEAWRVFGLDFSVYGFHNLQIENTSEIGVN